MDRFLRVNCLFGRFYTQATWNSATHPDFSVEIKNLTEGPMRFENMLGDVFNTFRIITPPVCSKKQN